MPRGTRREFSADDEQWLVNFLANHKTLDITRPTGNKLWKDMTADTAKYPWSVNHTWQSWRERYVKRQTYYDRQIKQKKKDIRLEELARANDSSYTPSPSPSRTSPDTTSFTSPLAPAPASSHKPDQSTVHRASQSRSRSHSHSQSHSQSRDRQSTSPHPSIFTPSPSFRDEYNSTLLEKIAIKLGISPSQTVSRPSNPSPSRSPRRIRPFALSPPLSLTSSRSRPRSSAGHAEPPLFHPPTSSPRGRSQAADRNSPEDPSQEADEGSEDDDSDAKLSAEAARTKLFGQGRRKKRRMASRTPDRTAPQTILSRLSPRRSLQSSPPKPSISSQLPSPHLQSPSQKDESAVETISETEALAEAQADTESSVDSLLSEDSEREEPVSFLGSARSLPLRDEGEAGEEQDELMAIAQDLLSSPVSSQRPRPTPRRSESFAVSAAEENEEEFVNPLDAHRKRAAPERAAHSMELGAAEKPARVRKKRLDYAFEVGVGSQDFPQVHEASVNQPLLVPEQRRKRRRI